MKVKTMRSNEWEVVQYLQVLPVPGEPGVELYPVGGDPAELVAPELGVAQQRSPFIDIMPTALQTTTYQQTGGSTFFLYKKYFQ